jgi:bifunctional non-homologous end joining protein LigD
VRRGADFTYRFPTIAEAVRGLSADRALIDGEAVVLRDDRRS